MRFAGVYELSSASSCCVALAGAGAGRRARTSFVGADKQWNAIVSFQAAASVKGRFVTGPVLIVHDSAKIGPRRGLHHVLTASIRLAGRAKKSCRSTAGRETGRRSKRRRSRPCRRAGMQEAREYQIAGDDEVHGVRTDSHWS